MTMAERWLYMPIIGVMAGTSFLLAGIAEKAKPAHRRAVYGACLAVIVIFGIRAMFRNADWKDGHSLYSHDEKIESRVSFGGSYDLENNLGVELFRAGKIEEAGIHFEKSIVLQPRWTYPHNNLGAVLERRGDLDGALKQYEKAIELSDYYLAYENKANTLIRMGKYAEAKLFLSDSLLKFPENNKMKLFLAWLYAAKNVSPDAGDRQKALGLLGQILSDDPDNGLARQLYNAIQSGQEI
jgi:tetratricopeptide (TPR) repeat protein